MKRYPFNYKGRDKIWSEIAEFIKDEMIYDIVVECGPFLGMKKALDNLNTISDPAWWIMVKDLAPTVLFKAALNYEGSIYMDGGAHITLETLPNYVKSLFPQQHRIGPCIEETLRRCGFE